MEDQEIESQVNVSSFTLEVEVVAVIFTCLLCASFFLISLIGISFDTTAER
jgi:hypothetical protein